MIRVRIDRIVIEGLPHLGPRALRRHLERELGAALSGLSVPPRRLGVPRPIVATATEREFAAALSASLRELLDGR